MVKGLSEEEVRAHYNLVFSSPSAPIVVEHMLTELGFFATNPDPILRNYATIFIGHIGSNDAEVNADSMVKAILSVGHAGPPILKTKE